MSTPQGEPDGSSYSREALQATIERKRHNDAVRRREFHTLRKLLQERSAVSPAASVRPSLFQSSMPLPGEDRATTLRKIDEIEAQMSGQWRRPREASRATPVVKSQAAALTETPGVPLVPVSPPAVQELAPDSLLEEAFIRFAEGDPLGAEAALLTLLEPGGLRVAHEETWLALFDLYRVTGQQALYEDRALAFADRFARSAPQWRRLSASVSPDSEAATGPGSGSDGGLTAPADALSVSAFGPIPADWTSPSVLDRPAVEALEQVVAGVGQTWRLSWTDLTSVQADALPAFLALLSRWSTWPLLRLRFIGTEGLDRALEARTVRADQGVDPAWWKLRLEALRLMSREDEFELAALDYCVTYELSPPPWNQPRCEVRTWASETPSSMPPEPEDSRLSQPGAASWSRFSGFNRGVASVFSSPMTARLSGVVVGDMTQALLALESPLPEAQTLVVFCADLERMDFAAASGLLNWVLTHQAQGRQVQLVDVHRLVAGLLCVTGVSAVAQVSLRRD